MKSTDKLELQTNVCYLRLRYRLHSAEQTKSHQGLTRIKATPMNSVLILSDIDIAVPQSSTGQLRTLTEENVELQGLRKRVQETVHLAQRLNNANTITNIRENENRETTNSPSISIVCSDAAKTRAEVNAEGSDSPGRLADPFTILPKPKPLEKRKDEKKHLTHILAHIHSRLQHVVDHVQLKRMHQLGS